MSIDSVFVHKMWDDYELSKMVDGGIPFPMLSDTGGKVGRVYGIFDEEAGVENRGRFIIDPEGVFDTDSIPLLGESIEVMFDTLLTDIHGKPLKVDFDTTFQVLTQRY